MTLRTPSAAARLCSLSDDELRAVLAFLPGVDFGACARVSSRWKATVDDDDHWQRLMRREYGVGEAVASLHDLVSDAVSDWQALYRTCHLSLFSSSSGGVAARRAYFAMNGSPAVRTLGTTVVRASLLRHSFSPVLDDAYAGLLPASIVECYDHGVS